LSGESPLVQSPLVSRHSSSSSATLPHGNDNHEATKLTKHRPRIPSLHPRKMPAARGGNTRSKDNRFAPAGKSSTPPITVPRVPAPRAPSRAGAAPTAAILKNEFEVRLSEPRPSAAPAAVYFACMRNHFACIKKHFACMKNDFSCIRNLFACIEDHFACIRKRFTCHKKHFACLGNRFACRKKRFAWQTN
jgi:hypothetical protein